MKQKKTNITKKIDVPTDPETLNKLNKYISLFNENTDKKANELNTSQNIIINDLVNKFLKDKILTNDFIKLDKPYYFNKNDLIKNGHVMASKTEPVNKHENYIIVDKIPNNLDRYSKKFNYYVYDDHYKSHKGVILYPYINGVNVKFYYLVFKYCIGQCLTIYLLQDKELINILDLEKDKDLYNTFQIKKNEIEQDLKKDLYIYLVNIPETKYNIGQDVKEFIKGTIKSKIYNHERMDKLIQKNQLKPVYNYILKSFDYDFKYFIYKNNMDSIEPLYIEDYKSNILYGHDKIIKFESYFYLRPYKLHKLINGISQIMKENHQIKKFMENNFKIDLELLKNFQYNYIFNPKIYNLINEFYLKEFPINLNTLYTWNIKNYDVENLEF